MGVMAIFTLAGALLIINSPDASFLASLAPFLKGFTVFYWATGNAHDGTGCVRLPGQAAPRVSSAFSRGAGLAPGTA